MNIIPNKLTERPQNFEFEAKINSSVLLTLEQISQVRNFITSNIDEDSDCIDIELQYACSMVKNIIEEVSVSNNSKISSSDLCQNYDGFTKNAKDIFQRLIVVELPKSLEVTLRHTL